MKEDTEAGVLWVRCAVFERSGGEGVLLPAQPRLAVFAKFGAGGMDVDMGGEGGLGCYAIDYPLGIETLSITNSLLS